MHGVVNVLPHVGDFRSPVTIKIVVVRKLRGAFCSVLDLRVLVMTSGRLHVRAAPDHRSGWTRFPRA